MANKFAIFDMDGTLVDSMELWNRLSEEYLSGLGVRVTRAQLEDTAHLTMPESAALFVRRFRLDKTPEQVCDEINALMEAHYRADIPLKPGAAEFLGRLKEAGVPMCVASSTAPRLIDLCLRRLGVRDCFAFLLSCEEVGAGKNRPDIYLEAARRMGGAPENTAVFEDIILAARTAKAAGFALGAVYDACSRHEWEELKALADCRITRWDDPAVLAWFLG